MMWRLHVGQYLLHQELVGKVGGVGDVGAVGATGAAGAVGASDARFRFSDWFKRRILKLLLVI